MTDYKYDLMAEAGMSYVDVIVKDIPVNTEVQHVFFKKFMRNNVGKKMNMLKLNENWYQSSGFLYHRSWVDEVKE